MLTPCAETRHACETGDGLDSYSWTEYDAREGGVQVLVDSKNNYEITTEFLKVAEGEHGGSWAARIKGKPIDPSESPATIDGPANQRPGKRAQISLVFYAGMEGLGGLEMDTEEAEFVSTRARTPRISSHSAGHRRHRRVLRLLPRARRLPPALRRR